ncbi:hypothetical protein FHS21_002126 [Phyllobacterium trifolii]|uniref:Uncharacterized protein n=1 Tax=Phyllobacterium trifolii TaxID=300193 RepID=A0A839U6V3_9HYPH|nr:hypothetical protein [Phyllobacterium trifolii]
MTSMSSTIIWSNCNILACHTIFTATVQFRLEKAF